MHNVHTGGMGGMILKQLFRDKRETYLTKYGGKNIGTAAAVPLPPSLYGHKLTKYAMFLLIIPHLRFPSDTYISRHKVSFLYSKMIVELTKMPLIF